MIVILDNYDSFTYNLYQYIGEINPSITVIRNDKVTVKELLRMPCSHLVISPGPGFPQSAGITVEAIQALAGKMQILGICLGHQAIAHAFGGEVVHAPKLFHGKASNVKLYKNRLFEGLPSVISAARYHSLIVRKETLPDGLEMIAQTAQGELMGLAHVRFPIYGLQFHPESVLTPEGKKILENFLSL